MYLLNLRLFQRQGIRWLPSKPCLILAEATVTATSKIGGASFKGLPFHIIQCIKCSASTQFHLG